MTQNKFIAALNKGKEKFGIRSHNLGAIESLIRELDQAIIEISEGKAELKKINKNEQAINFFGISLPSKRGEETGSQEINIILRIQSVVNPKVYTTLTTLGIGENGFPCTIVIRGNDYIARDIETLADNFSELLSTPFAFEAIKKAKDAEEDKQK